ncbi:MAG: hypothetical protein K0U98_24910 [Deltaproteobacteria bacterium]|nr:hypothetical protein [Deltaproteobacteria bacterium]
MLRTLFAILISLILATTSLAAQDLEKMGPEILGPTGTIFVDGTICTLSDAILAANADAPIGGCTGANGVDTLLLDADAELTSADRVNSSLLGFSFAGLPDITSTLILRANNGFEVRRDLSLPCTEDGTNHFRFFNVTSGGSLKLEGITLRNGCANFGGAVFVDGGGQILVSDSSFLDNTAHGSTFVTAGGGAFVLLDSPFPSSIERSLFQGNEARGPNGSALGGAIQTGDFSNTIETISATDFIANRAIAGADGAGTGARGGAISGWNISLVDSTFVQNQALAGGLLSRAHGGAVSMSGSALVLRTIFRENLARGGLGGPAGSGGYTGSPVSMEDCLFEANRAEGGDSATGDGGDATAGGASIFGIANVAGHVRRTTFVKNIAVAGDSDQGNGGQARGGGMYWDAEVDMNQVTLSENEALGGDSLAGDGGMAIGGAVYHQRTLPIVHHLTAVGNLARGGAGTIADGVGSAGGLCLNCGQPTVSTLVFDNSLLANNRVQSADGAPAGSDCEGGTGAASSGFNLAEVPGGCDFSGPNDQTGVDPMVLPLQEDGCSTLLPDGSCLPVHPLAPSSPALDAGSCTASGATQDARGSARPFDQPAAFNVDDGCDIGSFERGLVSLFTDGFESGDTAAWALTIP